MPDPADKKTADELANDVAEAAGKSVVGQVVSAVAGAAVTAATGGNVALGMATTVGVETMIAAAPQLAAAAERVAGAMSSAVSDVATAFGLSDGTVSTTVGDATRKHVVVPTTAALGETAGVLKSAGHTLAGARGGAGVSTATTEPSPETRAAATEVAKASENTDIGMAAHKAVKVDSKAPNAFAKIQALLLDKTKTSEEKLKEIGEIEGVNAIDDSSFKAFLGIAQAALGMDRLEGSDGKTSTDVSKFLTNLSEGFAKIFTPEPGKSREGGAEEMNAAFAVCGESMKVGIGTLPAMQEAIGAGFESGFKEAAKAAEAAREEEAKKARVPQTARPSADALEAVAPKEKLSLKEVGKDSLKIAGSIALSLLVPGGFLIAMAACYILRDKAPEKEEGLSDIDASLPIIASSRSSEAPAAPAAPAVPSTSAAIPSTAAAPAASAAPAPALVAPTAPASTPVVPAVDDKAAKAADVAKNVEAAEKAMIAERSAEKAAAIAAKKEADQKDKSEKKLVGYSRADASKHGVSNDQYDQILAEKTAVAEKAAEKVTIMRAEKAAAEAEKAAAEAAKKAEKEAEKEARVAEARAIEREAVTRAAAEAAKSGKYAGLSNAAAGMVSPVTAVEVVEKATAGAAKGNQYKGLTMAAFGTVPSLPPQALPSQALPPQERMLSKLFSRRGHDHDAPKEKGEVVIPPDSELQWKENPMRAARLEAASITEGLKKAGGVSAEVGTQQVPQVAGAVVRDKGNSR